LNGDLIESKMVRREIIWDVERSVREVWDKMRQRVRYTMHSGKRTENTSDTRECGYKAGGRRGNALKELCWGDGRREMASMRWVGERGEKMPGGVP